MPIYEYACDTCGHQFDVQQKFSDPLVTECEKCGKSVRKLISAPGILFKGTGWYVTDYSNKLKEPKAEGASSSAEGKKEGAKETKAGSSSDTKGKAGDSGSSSSTSSTSDNSSSSSSSSSSSGSSSSSSTSGTSSSPSSSSSSQ